LQIGTGKSSNPPNSSFTRQRDFPYWTLGMLVAGHSPFSCDGHSIVRKAPHLVLVPPRTEYTASSGPGSGRSGLHAIFTPSPRIEGLLELPQICGRAMGCAGISAPEARRLKAAFFELLSCDQGHCLMREQLLENSLERILLLAHELAARRRDRLDPRVRAAMEMLGADFGAPLSLASVARRLNTSVSSLSHLFSKQVGTSPMRFREERKMRRAKHLLLTTAMPVKTIAAQLGYANPFHFSRRFSARCGTNPSGYRAHPARDC